MTTNIAVALYSVATILFSFGALLAFLAGGSESFDNSIVGFTVGLVVSGVAWSLGSVLCYLSPRLRSTTSVGRGVRLGFTILFATTAAAWPWVGPSSMGLALIFAAFFSLGAIVPALITLQSDEPEVLRDAFAKALIGSALGAAIGAVLWSLVGLGSMFLFASAAALLAPVMGSSLFFADGSRARWLAVPFVVTAIGFSFSAPSNWKTSVESVEAEAATVAAPFAHDAVFQFRKEKKFDVFALAPRSSAGIAQFSEETLQTSVKSMTVHDVSGRRRLAGESRRFDLIQVLIQTPEVENKIPVWEATADTRLTVEAFRLYFDRLKDDGFLQIVGPLEGARGQATLATMAEAWKKSARPAIDVHSVAVIDEAGKTVRSVILRMRSFSREERDRLGEILEVGQASPKNNWILVSDASGVVLTDDRPFNEPIFQSASLGVSSRNMILILIGLILGLVLWVAKQERRKGLASRWQTASVATYFAGLGISFAFFQTYFVLRAMRGWDMPIVGAALVLAALFVTRAAGATLLAGHPRRRYGVRIQPLVSFVFAVLVTYLGAALFEPLVASGSEWVSAFVGMSVLIPFGLLGGSFLPNALEEASEKLAPPVLSLLWSLYIAGTTFGVYLGIMVGFERGLDVVFLAGLFSFAWVAIFSGLVRPWNVRKANAPSSSSQS